MRWAAIDEGAKQPSRRNGCTAVGVEQRIVVFGGTYGGSATSELWVLEVPPKSSKVVWKQPAVGGESPQARAAHTAAALCAAPTATSTAATHMVVFGGAQADGFQAYSDAFILSLYPPDAGAEKGVTPIFRDEVKTSVDQLTEKVTITQLAPSADVLGRPLGMQWVAASRVEEFKAEEPLWPSARHSHAAAPLWAA
jgi:hypothetical protein